MRRINRKYTYRRWCHCFGFDLIAMCLIARRNGMQIIRGFKLGMTVWNSLAIYGTPEQMAATDRDWTLAGAKKLTGRKPPGGWSIPCPPDRTLWDESKADWGQLEQELIARRRAGQPRPEAKA